MGLGALNVYRRSGSHPTSYPIDTEGFYPQEKGGRVVRPVPKLRMNESVPPFTLYDFMACIRIALPFLFYILRVWGKVGI
jgi:hypothetical protein